MEILSAGPEAARPVTGFDSRGAASVHLGAGSGPAHVHVLYFGAGGEIGPHPAGFGQLFLVTAGSGWVCGPDGRRRSIRSGQAARIAKGEVHAKGSETGMSAVMVQLSELDEAPC